MAGPPPSMASRTTIAIVLALGLLGLGVATVAAPAAASDAGSSTLSYPGTCTVRVGDTTLRCSGVGSVPDCRT